VLALNSDNKTVTMQAAAALARLALNNKNAQVEIAKSGGIAPLITLCDRFESEGTQEHAAAALAELALIPLTKRAIDQAGGISPLVSLLLYDGALTSKKHAAAALARLSIEGNANASQSQLEEKAKADKVLRQAGKLGASKAQQIAEAGAIVPLVSLLSGGRGADAQEAAAYAVWALAGDSDNRLAITESGGIGPLVLLLGCDNPKAREHAEAALVRLSIEIANREIIIKQLVYMLSDSSSEAAQEQAAAALANLARDSTDNRTSIVDAGGIVPLLALLESTSQKAMENAASALTQLCATRANQDAIAEAGGIQLLVNVLTKSSSNVKETSAISLCSLAACAIWELSKNHTANQLAAAEAGAINPLVAMLGSPQAEMQSNAAGALSTLASNNHDNQTAIARTGAIAPLCTLVREGSSETKEQSASALWSLAHENAPNKATIAKLGGVEPLVGLLVSGGSDRSQDFASGALASLSSKHSENRAAIAKRLVGLLNGRQPERAVRVLAAIASLSKDQSANQLAIAKVGGVPPIISWLSSSSEDAQREAAHAVLAVATNNATTQVHSLPMTHPCVSHSLSAAFF
jgi:vacuolar protein 8